MRETPKDHNTKKLFEKIILAWLIAQGMVKICDICG